MLGRTAALVAVIAALACVMLAAWGASASVAATSATPFEPTRVDAPDPQDGGNWAERSAATEDLDGDGVNDIFVAVSPYNIGALAQAGRVYLLSGRTRSVIYSIDSPEPQEGALFGFFISVLGDVSGDGKDDLAVGARGQDVYTGAGAPCGQPESNGCNENQGRAWVFSGASGAPLYRLDNPKPEPGAVFGSRIGRAGDLNGDHRSELIIGAPGNDAGTAGPGCGGVDPDPVPARCRRNEGQAFIFDGSADGLPARNVALRTLDMPDPTTDAAGSCAANCGGFGGSVQGPGDVDGDGVTDQLVDAGNFRANRGRMYLFSGQSGLLRAKIDNPSGAAATFGAQDVAPLAPGDLNGDGRAELYGNGFAQFGPTGPFEGRAWVFDGKATVTQGTGAVLFELGDPTPEAGGQFGWSMDDTDYNHDGTPDLYVGQSPHDYRDPERNNHYGGTYVFDGRNGSVLKRLELPASDVQPNDSFGPSLGWTASAPGDLNGDGEDDYVAGAPYLNVGSNVDQGRLYAFLSGPTPAEPTPPPAGGPAPPAGGPAPPSNPPGGGAGLGCPAGNSAGVRVIGRTNSGGRVFQGTNGNDRICGTSAGDLITGNGGRDVISGGGGDDRINGGSGSDRVNGGSGKDRVSGGSGNDSVNGSSGNDRINGNSGTDRISGGSGNDRLNGSTGNDVVSGSSGRDVISGSSGNDRLSGNSGNDRINGNSGNDRISGGSGNDRLEGGSGKDSLRGDSGNDRLSGNSGRDKLSGDSGKNKLKQ